MTQTAYPHFQYADDRTTAEPALPSTFHARFPAHFVGQRTDDSLWPAHSSQPEALRNYREGQAALYELKDAAAAILAYEAALDADPSYFHAWVALAIALITDNTDASLVEAQEILDALSALPIGEEGIPSGAASIVRQNRAYLALHRWRRGDGGQWLADSDTHYRAADALDSTPRPELHCPWAAVRFALGDLDGARKQFEHARFAKPGLIPQYIAKYPSLATFDSNGSEPLS